MDAFLRIERPQARHRQRIAIAQPAHIGRRRALEQILRLRDVPGGTRQRRAGARPSASGSAATLDGANSRDRSAYPRSSDRGRRRRRRAPRNPASRVAVCRAPAAGASPAPRAGKRAWPTCPSAPPRAEPAAAESRLGPRGDAPSGGIHAAAVPPRTRHSAHRARPPRATRRRAPGHRRKSPSREHSSPRTRPRKPGERRRPPAASHDRCAPRAAASRENPRSAQTRRPTSWPSPHRRSTPPPAPSRQRGHGRQGPRARQPRRSSWDSMDLATRGVESWVSRPGMHQARAGAPAVHRAIASPADCAVPPAP